MTAIKFKAKPFKPMGDAGAWCFVTLPEKVHRALGGARGRIPIVITACGHSFRTSAMPMDGEHHFMFNGVMRAATGKEAGDLIAFEIAVDTKPRTVAAPKDLAAALRKNPPAKARWDKLSYSHRKEYVGAITEAKRPETRAKRIACCIAMLGKQRV